MLEEEQKFVKEQDILGLVSGSSSCPYVSQLLPCPQEDLDSNTINRCFCTQLVQTDANPIKQTANVDLGLVSSTASKLATGLACLSKRKIVHNDIKSDNVLISTNYDPVIVDFGEARMVDDTPVFQGTVGIMGPETLSLDTSSESEQLETKGTQHNINTPYETQADMWSFGVLLFEWIFGCAPQIVAVNNGPQAGATLLTEYNDMIKQGEIGLYSNQENKKTLVETLSAMTEDSKDKCRYHDSRHEIDSALKLLTNVVEHSLTFDPTKRLKPRNAARILDQVAATATKYPVTLDRHVQAINRMCSFASNNKAVDPEAAFFESDDD